MGEWLLLAAVVGAVGLFVAWPLLGEPDRRVAGGQADRETLEVQHRLALEALRDVEADRRAGSLDEEAYRQQRSEAEERAARTLDALDAPAAAPPETESGPRRGAMAGAARPTLVLAAILVLALAAGFALPAPIGVGERTQTNQALLDAIDAAQARQDQIDALLDRLTADPSDTQTLSELADAYLAGGSPDDLQRAARALIVLINYAPDDASAYRRLMTAYINAGDWTDASATLDAFREVVGDDEPDVPFFAGLIALRGDGDRVEAIRQFDRFLRLAPDDPRGTMVRALRAQAESDAGGGG